MTHKEELENAEGMTRAIFVKWCGVKLSSTYKTHSTYIPYVLPSPPNYVPNQLLNLGFWTQVHSLDLGQEEKEVSEQSIIPHLLWGQRLLTLPQTTFPVSELGVKQEPSLNYM